MTDCLVLVERGAAGSVDIIATGYKKAVMNALERMRNAYPAEIEPFCVQKKTSESSAITLYQNELQLSLTSITLATSLYRSGVDFVIYDDEDILEKRLVPLEAQIKSSIKYVCISTTYIWDINRLKSMIRFFHDRDRGIKIILGGQSLMVWGERVIEELENVFCYCYGDMDIDFGNIMAGLLYSRKPEDLLTKVSKNGKSFYTVKKYIADLDTIFIPDWGLLKKINFNDNYFTVSPLPERIPVEERRGCYNKCAFCSYHTINKHRQKSPARILEELIHIKNLGYKKVCFTGSELLMPPSKSRELLRLIIKEGLDLDIFAAARIDILYKNPDLIGLMVAAGVTCLDFGVESGDQTILKNMNKNFDLKIIPSVIDRLRKNNIDIWASFIFGFPGETSETIKNTIDFIIRSNFTVLDFHVLQVVPGTPLDMNREKYQLKLLGNIWGHSTMSLKDMPAVMRKVFTETYSHCDSVVRNVNDYIGKHIPQKKGSIETAKAINKCLHEVIYIEYNDAIKKKEKHLLKVWNELKQHIEYIPNFLLK